MRIVRPMYSANPSNRPEPAPQTTLTVHRMTRDGKVRSRTTITNAPEPVANPLTPIERQDAMTITEAMRKGGSYSCRLSLGHLARVL